MSYKWWKVKGLGGKCARQESPLCQQPVRGGSLTGALNEDKLV